MTWKRFGLGALAFSAALALAAASAEAQLVVKLPAASSHAVAGQRVGLTDVTVTYSRPLVKGRKLWGVLVPYGETWRAGANENTTFEVSDAVTVEGQPLPAGVYGLHTVPTADAWTIIFSKNSTSWGSFFYDKAEDALRVTVKPVSAEMTEALTYEFGTPSPDFVTLALRWEKLAAPMRIAVSNEVTLGRIRNQLRTLPAFTWEGWNEAATYAAEKKIDLPEALQWADKSIGVEERFENLETKARVLALTGKTSEAETVMAKAVPKASAPQLHNYGRQLLTEKKTAQAMKVFQMNAQKNPGVWFVYGGLARGELASGDRKNASKHMKEALSRAPEDQKKYVQGLVTRIDAGEDIN